MTPLEQKLQLYPNWAGSYQPRAVKQRWAAENTCMRRQREFIYSALMLDVYSRRTVGWALGHTPGGHNLLPRALQKH